MLIGIFNPMGAQSDRLRCEVCQNLFLSPMNTGLLRPAVATALTVYGIETFFHNRLYTFTALQLQQHLPFTVLKHSFFVCSYYSPLLTVATALTVYGIETLHRYELDPLQYCRLQQHLPFTVLKLYRCLSGIL